jgi:uncharacterized repeat protein (TIGR01451 family)
MITRISYGLRTALVAVAALGWWTGVNAQETAAGTTIANRASVNYSVGGITQEVINSSPTGNTTPGASAGADTSFLVDNRVDLTVDEISGNATIVTPGMTNQVLAFTVVNEGNAPQGYQLTIAEEVASLVFGNTDNANFGNLVIRVDDGNGTYDGTETATAIDVLNPSQSITVFVVSPTVPGTLINNNFANVRLTATTAEPGTNGATLVVESTGANTDAVEVLFNDALDADGFEFDVDQFAVVTAGLTISKAQTVVSDPFGSASPRALPDSVVQYLITITNTSTTTAADDVSLTDPVPPNTTFVGTNVALTGVAAAACTADAGDADDDGCGIAAGTLTVDDTVIGDIAASSTVTVAFQVTIN